MKAWWESASKRQRVFGVVAIFYVSAAALVLGLASAGVAVPAVVFLLAVPLLLGFTGWGLYQGYGESRAKGAGRWRAVLSSPAMAVRVWFKLGL